MNRCLFRVVPVRSHTKGARGVVTSDCISALMQEPSTARGDHSGRLRVEGAGDRLTKNNRMTSRSPSTSPRHINAEYGTKIRYATRQTANPWNNVEPTTWASES